MVTRFIRSMCSPQLQPSVCTGVLFMVMVGVELWSSGIDMERLEYHWRRLLCMRRVVCGGRKLSGL
jgi:hypothetical protein